jgi:oxidase EvaA
LVDQIQSEQGARFLKKRNRNIVINVDEEIEVYDNFMWLTLGQIKDLMKHDNLVNMDTRTVVSGIPFGSFGKEVIDFYSFLGIDKHTNPFGELFLKSALTKNDAFHTLDEIISFLTALKSTYELEVSNIPLSSLNKWVIQRDSITHVENKFFKVIGVEIEIGNREVNRWCQPLIEPAQEGLCAFVVKEIGGILHFAMQAKLECGNHDIVEFAPTVQCLTGNYRQTLDGALPFLSYVLNAKKDDVIFDSMQSEEGGRFFREQNRNMIVLADKNISDTLPPNYIWMTLNQLFTFLKFNNYLNIQARSLIASVCFS